MSNDPNETRVFVLRWNELGKYLKQGMQMITVMPGPGAQTTMLAVVPDELVAELEKVSKGRKKPSLREILVDLVGWAAFKPGDVKRAKLTGGLGIDVIYGIDGMWRLQIWRQGALPSLKEWEVVLKSWPEPLPQIEYKRFDHNGKQYMRGEWRIDENQGNLPGDSDAATGSPAGADGPDRVLQQPG